MGASRRSAARFLLVLAAFAQAGAAEGLRGLSLADALDKLRNEGLPVVYSTSLVKPEMRVEEEPDAESPRQVLDLILRPHGLAVRQARGGQLVVVPSKRPRESAPESARPPGPAMPALLEEIVVTPSHLRLLQEEPESRHSLTGEQIDRMPHLGGDAFRAVKRLPGTGGADVSARFNVRGGDSDELLIVLDGLELYEPFHLKDFMSLFSTVDAAAVGSVDLLTGGFPAEYGDRMSGVMEIRSAAPSAELSSSISVGTINSYFVSSGTGSNGWEWLLAARGWYPHVVLDRLKNLTGELRTDYSDVFAKLQRRVGSRSTIGIGALVAWDDLGFVESEPGEIERVGAQYGSQHLWANIATDWTPRLHSRAVIGGGNLTRHRSVSKIELDEGELSVSDQRSFQFLSLKQDWAFEWNEHQLLKGGIDLRAQRADYDYVATSSFEGGLPLPGGDPSDRSFVVDLEPRGESYAAYLADRVQLAPSVIAEVGLRWDKQFWLEDNQVSPRAQLRWEVGPRSFLRLAWGRYFQSQRLNELQVEDGVSQFFPAQLSEHWIASAEHWFDGGGGLRIEAYWKDLSRPRPRYENLFNPLELFPEAQRDRVLVSPDAAHSTGLELLARTALHERASWWASYAWAKAVDEFDGETVPRSWDQRHTVNAGLNLTFPRRWNVNLGGTWHTGWPTTAVTAMVSGDPDDPGIELVPGLRNRQRLPDYFRLDLRASRTVPFRSGTLTFIADILNLTNHRNVCCLDDVSGEILEDGSVELTRDESTWAPITPTLAVRWRL